MYILSSFIFVVLASVLAAPAIDAGSSTIHYSASKTWDFRDLDGLPSDLIASKELIRAGSPKLLNHRFEPANVYVQDGFLQLLVPGGQQGQKTISSAQVVTSLETLYGSATIAAILTQEAGVCNGLFFYRNDSEEVDIEWISDPKSKSNLNSPTGKRMMQYTNQALNNNPADATMHYGPAPSDATSTVHNYTLEWTPNSTMFDIDGVFQRKQTRNVPNASANFILNNWVDGSPGWTRGPPVNDALLRIQRLTIQYNP